MAREFWSWAWFVTAPLTFHKIYFNIEKHVGAVTNHTQLGDVSLVYSSASNAEIFFQILPTLGHRAKRAARRRDACSDVNKGEVKYEQASRRRTSSFAR
jgi:hypothetical protein